MDTSVLTQVESLGSTEQPISLSDIAVGDTVVLTFAKEPEAGQAARLQILVTSSSGKGDRHPFVQGRAHDNRNMLNDKEVLLSGMRTYGSLMKLGQIAVGAQPVVEYGLTQEEIKKEETILKEQILSGNWPLRHIPRVDFVKSIKERGLNSDLENPQSVWDQLISDFTTEQLVWSRRSLNTPIATKIEIIKVGEDKKQDY